ncbi:MAG: hypothetical protein QW429_05605 [Thermoprotei archaeon]
MNFIVAWVAGWAVSFTLGALLTYAMRGRIVDYIGDAVLERLSVELDYLVTHPSELERLDPLLDAVIRRMLKKVSNGDAIPTVKLPIVGKIPISLLERFVGPAREKAAEAAQGVFD